MPDQPRLLPPSPGLQVCIRRLLEARPETTKEAHSILKRTWPRVTYATADLAFAHYLDATVPEDAAPNVPIKIEVARLDGRMRAEAPAEGETEENQGVTERTADAD